MDVTQLLRSKEREHQNQLFSLVYEELRSIASQYMRRESPDHTIQATSLIHEVYFRLIDQDIQPDSRNEFFRIASRSMRTFLIDYARAKKSQKRGGEHLRLDLEESEVSLDLSHVGEEFEWMDFDLALKELEGLCLRQAQIVELRFFGGLSNEEIAENLGISISSVKREFVLARAWLFQRLNS